MKKIKIQTDTIAADYNEETGLSKVVILTDLGLFTGYSKLHPEDKNIASHFAGCRYAEMRANIKYIKQKIKIIKYKLEPLYKIYKDLKNRKNCNLTHIGIKILEKEIYVLEDEKKIFEGHLSNLKQVLEKAIDERPNIINKIINKKQDNE